jgi:PAS domain S-box-containing protein
MTSAPNCDESLFPKESQLPKGRFLDANPVGNLGLATDPILIIDTDGYFSEINSPAVTSIGYNEEDLRNENLGTTQIITKESKRIVLRNFSALLNDIAIEPYDIEIVTKNGAKKWFKTTSQKTKLGSKTAVAFTLREVTERKKIENSLRQTEKIHRAICESSPVIVLNVDLKGIITYANNRLETFGFNTIQVIGNNFLSLVSKEFQARVVSGHINAIAGKTIEQEIRIVTPKGEIEATCTHNPLKINGRITGCQIILEDITEKKQLEKRLEELSASIEDEVKKRTKSLRESKDELKEYSKLLEQMLDDKTKKLRELERMAAIGELAGMVGHDIRNPLAAIKNATFYLKRKQSRMMDATCNQMLTIIEDSIRHADKIINDLVEYSREVRLELEEIDPKTLIEQALTQISIPQNIQLHQHIDCEQKLLVDPNKLVRVVLNIMKNAVDSMPDGGNLNIDCYVEGCDVIIGFADTGKGIPPEIAAKLFTPLVTTKAQGMGFGLSICKRLVEAHGGRITVSSKVDVGTIVTLSLACKKQ